MKIPKSDLEKRIIDITYKHKLTHLNGCLTAVQLIDNIYKIKKEKDLFVLSSGHVALALFVVLEKKYGFDAEKLQEQHGTHPKRDLKHKIYCSSGSLGQAITVAVGMALANRKRDVYVLTSDGELAEGSCWEALRVAGEQRLENMKILVNANGSSGYEKTDVDILDIRLQYFYPTMVSRTHVFKYPEWLQGFAGHYVILDEAKYKELTK